MKIKLTKANFFFIFKDNNFMTSGIYIFTCYDKNLFGED